MTLFPQALPLVRRFLTEPGDDVRPPLVVVTGPTASGKTSLGIEIALGGGNPPAAGFPPSDARPSASLPPPSGEHPLREMNSTERMGDLRGEILAVDSRTVYRGLDLGTAKPTAEERAAAPHHLLDLFDPTERVDAFTLARIAREKVAEIRGRGNLPILVGGTGLWLEAAAGVLAPPAAPADPAVRLELGKLSVQSLDAELRAVDPVSADAAAGNRRRLERAVEILRATGLPPSSQKSRVPGPDRVLWLILDWPPDALRARIAERAAGIFRSGLLDEARDLFSKFPADAPAFTAIVYPLARAVLAGELSEAEAIRRFATLDCQYAKRQRTWWRHRELPLHFLRPAGV